MLRLSPRIAHIAPFYAMEVVKQAAALQAEGRDIVQMSIGEPDFPAIPAVVEALQRATREGKTQYTEAVGIAPLREAIAEFLRREAQAARQYMSELTRHSPYRQAKT